MSQKASAPRPASRRRSTSNPSPDGVVTTFSSPPAQPTSQAGLALEDESLSSMENPGGSNRVVTEDEGRGQFSGTRASGVQDILNPPGLHSPYTEHLPSSLYRAAEEVGTGMDMGGRRPSGQVSSPPQPYPFQAQHPPDTAQQQPIYPPLAPLSTPGSINSNLRRGSPTIGPSLPPMGVPRHILMPMSPRAASSSRLIRGISETQQSPLMPQLGLGRGPVLHQMSTHTGPVLPGGLPQMQSLGQGASLPPTTSPGPVRSFSHSVVGRALSTPSSIEPLPSSGRIPMFNPGPPAPYQPPMQTARDVVPGGQFNDNRWSGGPVGSRGMRSWPRGLPMGEGQPIFAITPQSGEEIFIPVDTHQGSKSADERRLRNAGASQRFRSRKKEKESMMEEENRRLSTLVRQLEQQRDFYRNERNRLRDLVVRTPSISEWAIGPPTPTAAHDDMSPEAESRPMTSHPTTRRRTSAQTRPYPYGSDEASSSEPPQRRRRTEQIPDFRTTSPAYDTQTIPRPMAVPPTFPQPAPSSTYSLTDLSQLQPILPGVAMLPPLRLENQTAGSEQASQLQPQPGSGIPSQAQPLTRPPGSYGRASQERGWAGLPRGPDEGGPRR